MAVDVPKLSVWDAPGRNRATLKVENSIFRIKAWIVFHLYNYFVEFVI